MKRRIQRNILISVGVFFALARLLAAGTNDSTLSVGNRPLNAHYTTFDVKDAGTGPGQGTQALAINASGVIAGVYADAGDVYHAFVRDATSGAITTFDALHAGTNPGEGTQATSINQAGDIAGSYVDANAAFHGFL